MNKKTLRNYAALIAKKGVSIKEGQEVIIRAALDQPEFIAILTEECYRAGAGKVTVEWRYQPITKHHYSYQSAETLSTLHKWEKEKLKHYVRTLPATISIASEDPSGLAGIDQEKVSESSAKLSRLTKPFRDEMDNRYQWCVAAVPGKAWAKKVFPDLPAGKAMQKLWDAILMAARADGEDPVERWNEHNENLRNRCRYLNGLGLKELQYTSSNGTDFTIGLLKDGLFLGGSDFTLDGTEFDPNIPTEEVFTAPDRTTAKGVLHSTMPLSYRGELIENFWFVFENGKVTEVHAEKNEELLKKMVSMDEGASYLGECALVPFDSPINKSGILFYNTLFDENASCHFAFGKAYTNCIKDFEKYTRDELKELGLNDSIIHVDFMVGSEDLKIEGTATDGRKVLIFRDGNWAF